MDHPLTKRLATIRAHLESSHDIASSSTDSSATLVTPNPTAGGWVITQHDGFDCIREGTHSLRGKTVFVTGGSRGIGLAIAVRCAREGANVVLAAKTTEEQPTLEGTIFTAAAAVEKAGGQALPLKCDIRDEKSVEEAVKRAVERFGGIDILINNASAISLTGTLETSMKKYDLINSVDGRGTYMTTQKCLPYLLESAKKNRNPHVLTLSPPLDMQPKWFKNNVAYAIAKFSMSMCTLGWAAEFKREKIAFNSLWPRTAVATAAVQNLLGGDIVVSASRNTDIMADAAYAILTSSSEECTGHFFVDDLVLLSCGVGLVEIEKKYNIDKSKHSGDLAADFFV